MAGLLNQARQPRLLKLTPEGDPILRTKCQKLSKDKILSTEIQNLIDDIKFTSRDRRTGVGLSANQVGQPIAISVIAIKPTPGRPNLQPFDKICINTEIVETFGDRELMWEGCQSITRNESSEPAMAQVPRYTKIRIKYFDEGGNERDEVIDGFAAHVVQHETDHLNGIIFTDLVDEKDLITYQEFTE
ncbi:MAG: peptide deformylase [Candidatus Nomurabacteria bacterium]|jgi:peptide deformylase|nr:peptide deformylase [Candidatus Nomurabacteria bacterium]